MPECKHLKARARENDLVGYLYCLDCEKQVHITQVINNCLDFMTMHTKGHTVFNDILNRIDALEVGLKARDLIQDRRWEVER